MRFLYSLLSYLFLPIAIFKLAKNHKLARVSERLGFFESINDELIWIHCVSVGEFLAARVLIDTLLTKHKILITTTTQTASTQVLKHYPKQVLHLYFPFDCPLIIRRYIKKIQPKMLLILETEIWPNLIHYLHKNNTPTLVINARLSQKSFKKYQKFGKFSTQTLNKLSRILTQDNKSQQRFIQLGANNTQTLGNIKFDQNSNVDKNIKKILTQIIGNRQVITFASTHDNEEMQIINSYLKYQNQIKALLIIIPRHPERFNEVEKLIKNANLSISRRSNPQTNTQVQILLGDSMGEMMAYFSMSDIVFMGGSLNDTGGHNMLEPAALSKPIIFGANVFNFAQISADLLKQNGAIQVQNADELFAKIIPLLNNKTQLNTLGGDAKHYFDSQQGALEKLTKIINKAI